MLISFLILGTTFSLRIWISVVPVIVGMILACYGDVENITIWSLTILISGCFASGLKIVMTKVLLSGSHRYHPFDLLQKVTPLCAIQLTPVILYLEYSGLRVDDSVNLSQWMVVFATGIMAFSLNIANFFTNRVVSPLTLTVAGNLKQVLTILLSIFIFSTKITPLNGIGIFVTILGGADYNRFFQKQKVLNEKL
ncbi:uncharacterized protein LOC135119581 [Zophobas morio]|uniref:uncharacterized protein LOC135119581 n=1 Tax=Zophobas morio TaxID=2755281 RepID=UPI003082C032